MSSFGTANDAKPDLHGKIVSDAERKTTIRRIESDLSILSGDRLKFNRRKTDRDLELRKLKRELRRVEVEVERAEVEAKKDEVELRSIEENIRLTKKRLATM